VRWEEGAGNIEQSRQTHNYTQYCHLKERGKIQFGGPAVWWEDNYSSSTRFGSTSPQDDDGTRNRRVDSMRSVFRPSLIYFRSMKKCTQKSDRKSFVRKYSTSLIHHKSKQKSRAKKMFFNHKKWISIISYYNLTRDLLSKRYSHLQLLEKSVIFRKLNPRNFSTEYMYSPPSIIIHVFSPIKGPSSGEKTINKNITKHAAKFFLHLRARKFTFRYLTLLQNQ
jgi:hypothetical protein